MSQEEDAQALLQQAFDINSLLLQARGAYDQDDSPLAKLADHSGEDESELELADALGLALDEALTKSSLLVKKIQERMARSGHE